MVYLYVWYDEAVWRRRDYDMESIKEEHCNGHTETGATFGTSKGEGRQIGNYPETKKYTEDNTKKPYEKYVSMYSTNKTHTRWNLYNTDKLGRGDGEQ